MGYSCMAFQRSRKSTNAAGKWDRTEWIFKTGMEHVAPASVHFPPLHLLPLCLHRVGTNTFTRRYLQEQGGIVGDSKARRSTCDARCISHHPTCF